MIIQRDINASLDFLDELDAQSTHHDFLGHPTARETLDALAQEDRTPNPSRLAIAQGHPHSVLPAGASPAVPFSAPQCEAELQKMVEVQREVLATLEEFLPDCAAASPKARILVSELLRVTEEQSTFILRLKTQLAMRDLFELRK